MSLFEWLIFFLCYNLIISGGTQKLFMIAGISSWKSIIPIYNIIKILELINRPKWWIILVFIPVINLIMIPVILVEFVKKFNHNSKLDRDKGEAYFLRGNIQFKLNNIENACNDWKKSNSFGKLDAEDKYNKFCPF